MHERMGLNVIEVRGVRTFVEQMPRLKTCCNQPEDNNGHKRATAGPLTFVLCQSSGVIALDDVLELCDRCPHQADATAEKGGAGPRRHRRMGQPIDEVEPNRAGRNDESLR